jgi:hypothetical protein
MTSRHRYEAKSFFGPIALATTGVLVTVATLSESDVFADEKKLIRAIWLVGILWGLLFGILSAIDGARGYRRRRRLERTDDGPRVGVGEVSATLVEEQENLVRQLPILIPSRDDFSDPEWVEKRGHGRRAS